MFLKFPKINHFSALSEEDISTLFNKTTRIEVYEKIDGSHLGIYVNLATNTVNYYTRTGLPFNLGDFDSNVSDKLSNTLLIKLKELSDTLPGLVQEFYLDAEAFGPRILRRLKYPDETQVRIYQLRYKDPDGWVYWHTFKESPVGNYWLFPKSILCRNSEEDNLQEMLKAITPLPFKSDFTTDGSNAEGYVFYFYLNDGSLIMIKEKDEMFSDKASKKVALKVPNEAYELMLNYREEFKTYINDNRIHDVASKGYTKISNLIPAIISDARVDFEKDHPNLDLELSKELIKQVYNLGSMVYLKTISLGYKNDR